jgi:hypothetical protein
MGRVELALIAILLASPASAQDEPEVAPSSEAEREALRLFNEARDAFEERRYADARRSLERSLELAPRGATAMNLARVLRSLGAPVEAERVLEAILDGDYGEPTGERRADAIALRAEVVREIARLEITIRGGAASVRVDGERVRSAEDGRSFEHRVDPGRHVIIATSSDGRAADREIVVEPGERAAVEIDLGAVPPAVDEGAPAWPWILAGTGLALAAGAAVLIIVLATSDPEPVGDPQGVYPIIEALRF